jgi:hypothetical protein
MTDNEAKEILRIFDNYRDYMKHEDGLLAHRLSWLLGSTGLIAAAYGSLAAYILHVYWEIAAKNEAVTPIALKVLQHQLVLLAPLFIFSYIGMGNAHFAYRSIIAAKASIESFPPKWKMMIARYPEVEKLRLPALRHGFSDEKKYSVRYSETICENIRAIWRLTLLADILIAAEAISTVMKLGRHAA